MNDLAQYEPVLKIILWAFAVPAAFVVFGLFMSIITKLMVSADDRMEKSKQLTPSSFLKGESHGETFFEEELRQSNQHVETCQTDRETGASQSKNEDIVIDQLETGDFRQVRQDQRYIYKYRWLNENELIFLRIHEPIMKLWPTIYPDKHAPPIVKNHAIKENGEWKINCIHLEGGAGRQKLFLGFLAAALIFGLVDQWGTQGVFITIFGGIPIAIMMAYRLVKGPEHEAKNGLELILNDS